MKPVNHPSNVVPLRPAPPKLPPLTTLSFVHDYWVRRPGRKRGEPFRCFWAVSPSGNYLKDGEAGRLMALEWLRTYGRFNIGPNLLAWCVADMPPKLTALEIDFISRIGLLAGNNLYAEEIIQRRDEKNKQLMAELEA